MNVAGAPRTFVWIAVFSVFALFGGPPLGAPHVGAAQVATGLPEFENEFFNDFSGSVSNAQKIEISRNLRLASESSQIHSMLVVIRRVADFPELPQEVHPMAVQLARERKIGSQKTQQGLLALFALDDHKFTVVNSQNVSATLAETIRNAFNGRVRERLRGGQTGQALVFASEDLASLLPKANAAARATTPGNGSSSSQATSAGPAQQRAFSSSLVSESARPETQKSTGGGWGTWIVILLGGYLLLSLLGRLFSGGGGGGVGGGRPGWGGLLGGLLGGGLLGYWLGSSSSHASDSHHDSGVFGGGGSDSGSGGSHDGPDSSDSGGFDSFGGGDFGGGGSDGDW